MEIEELLFQERNRLSRLSTTVSVLCILLASWARAPLLRIELPLGGAKIDNLTAAHAVLIGLPLVTFLYVLVSGQILRAATLAAAASRESHVTLDWSQETIKLQPRILVWIVACAVSTARYVVVVLVPFVASLILFTSYFDFRICTSHLPNCAHADEVPTSHFLFSSALWEIKPSYISLNDDPSGTAKIGGPNSETINETRALIREHIPYIYAPLQSWAYVVLQILNTACFIFGSIVFLGKGAGPRALVSSIS